MFGTQDPSSVCFSVLIHDTCLLGQNSCLDAYHHLYIPAGGGLGGGRREHVLRPSMAFPGNSIHLSHRTDPNHVAQTSCKVCWEGICLLFSHQVAMCPDKS